MSQFVEKTGKTVQEAIFLALEELQAENEDVDIEVLEEGSKGLFGIGGKVAKIRVTLKDTQLTEAKRFLINVFSKMYVSVEIEAQEDDESILFNIKGEDSGIIIGRRGETLDALQYLTSLVANKNRDDYKRVTVDIENYRKKREETLIRLANRLAERVERYKKDVTLEPMNPFERRIIHSTLQDNRYVETYSVGEEPNRKIVIRLKQSNSYKRM